MSHFLFLRPPFVYFFGFLALAMLMPVQEVSCAPFLPGGGGQENENLYSVLGALDRQQGLIVGIQRELVARPAIGPEYGGDGEEEKARWLADWLHERGLEKDADGLLPVADLGGGGGQGPPVVFIERLDFPDERVLDKVRPNIVAVYPGAGQGRTLWLLSHLDVAKAGRRELWDSDPFALRVDGDALYGRGVEDNNQAITVSLMLLEALRETGITPPMRLGLVITSGALTDYGTGIGHVVKKRPDLFKPEDLILVMDYGDAEGCLVSVGEKGNLWLKISVTGKEGHAGNPDKANNAFAAGAALAHGLAGLEKKFTVQNPLFTPPRVTITPTRSEDYSTGVNHVPEKFVFYADVRVTPEYSFADVEKAVRGLADALEREHGVGIALERVEETPPALVTPDDAPVVAALDSAIRAELGVTPRHIGGMSVTIAATLRNRRLNVAVWGVQETMHNRINEYALISAHIRQARVIARMLFGGNE